MEYYGFRGHVNLFIRSYLENRQQFALINGKKSNTTSIETGVPQGSVLGPLLFIVYVNDLVNSIKDGKTTLFADDTSILLHDKDLKLLKHRSENTLKEVYDWLVCNKLTLSWEKTFFVIYHSYKKNADVIHELRVYDNRVKRAKSAKYLGMIIDETLSWNEHVTNLCNTLSRNFNLFYNIRNIIPDQLKKNLYYSLVYSHIQYGIELYGACKKQLSNKIQILQNKLLKVLFNLPYREDTNKLHYTLKVLKVDDIRKANILKFVYEAINKISIKVFHNHYIFHRDIHNRNSRQSYRLYLNRVNTKYGENTIQYKGTKLWNDLKLNTQKCSSIHIFKKAIKQQFLEKYKQ